MIVTLTGASGFIGSRLIARLQRDGHRVRVLGRRKPAAVDAEFAAWEAVAAEPPVSAVAECDAVIHLAGEPVAQRWSADVKRRIRDSRIIGTRNLVTALGKSSSRPATLISASAIGYYGDRGDQPLNEAAPPGKDFLASVCVEWEAEARKAAALGLRTDVLRIGIVLGTEGGALKAMLGPFRSGVGGPAGSGKQWVSWIHVDDVVELLVFSLMNPAMGGTVNATAPDPVRNADFAKELGRVLHRPAAVSAPAFALKLMFGEMAEVVLASQRVLPEAATRAGFVWKYPHLPGALENLLTSR
jgi:uncharacterized protein (TIGR01777 family)